MRPAGVRFVPALVALMAVIACGPSDPQAMGPTLTPTAPTPSNAAASPTGAPPDPTPTATPCSSPTPSPPPPLDEPQPEINGRTIDPHPYFEGLIALKVAACASPIDDLIARYGLKGPATQVFTPPFNESARRVGLDRHFQVGVETGTEQREVERLATHPEDFEVVSLAVDSWGGVGEIRSPTPPDPAAGPPGTSFTMQVCCWKAGMPVTKTFVVPDGKTHVVNDVVRDDNRVPATWGGSRSDPRGLYHVVVRGAGRDGSPVAARMRFAVGGSCRIRTQYIGDSDNAIYGHAPDRIELTFCNGRRPSGPELRIFSGKYVLSFINSEDRDGAAVYTFGVPPGRRPVDLVRELLRDDRVRSAAVVPVVPGR